MANKHERNSQTAKGEEKRSEYLKKLAKKEKEREYEQRKLNKNRRRFDDDDE